MLDEDALVREYWGRGRSLQEIADDEGVVKSTVLGWMRKYGIERRENPGGHQNEEVEVTCDYCGETASRPPSHVARSDVYFCSTDCRSAWNKENEARYWEWGEGRTYGGGWNELRQAVRERDKRCQVCGAGGEGVALQVHHIIPAARYESPDEADLDDLVLLCARCHGLAESGSIEKLIERGGHAALKYVATDNEGALASDW